MVYNLRVKPKKTRMPTTTANIAAVWAGNTRLIRKNATTNAPIAAKKFMSVPYFFINEAESSPPPLEAMLVKIDTTVASPATERISPQLTENKPSTPLAVSIATADCAKVLIARSKASAQNFDCVSALMFLSP
jgi:hypothetical protein